MKSLTESIMEQCASLSEAAKQIEQDANRFLSCFDTHTILGLGITEEQEKSYQSAFQTLLFSLLANLEKTDKIGAALSSLVTLSDDPRRECDETFASQMWSTYERYRALIIQYLEDTNFFIKRNVAQDKISYADLVSRTRDLIHNARLLAENFTFDFPNASTQTNL